MHKIEHIAVNTQQKAASAQKTSKSGFKQLKGCIMCLNKAQVQTAIKLQSGQARCHRFDGMSTWQQGVAHQHMALYRYRGIQARTQWHTG